MKRDILRGMRVPGWERISEVAREAVIDELCGLPEDIGEGRVREPAPTCARLTEVIDALRRASERDVVTDNDRRLITGWQSLGHAGSIGAFLDLATIASNIGAHALTVGTGDSDLIGRPCPECDEPIAVGDMYEPVAMRGEEGEGLRAIAVHTECMALRLIGHEFGVCSCTGYAGIVGTRAQARELARRREAYELNRRGMMS